MILWYLLLALFVCQLINVCDEMRNEIILIVVTMRNVIDVFVFSVVSVISFSVSSMNDTLLSRIYEIVSCLEGMLGTSDCQLQTTKLIGLEKEREQERRAVEDKKFKIPD